MGLSKRFADARPLEAVDRDGLARRPFTDQRASTAMLLPDKFQARRLLPELEQSKTGSQWKEMTLIIAMSGIISRKLRGRGADCLGAADNFR
jgi:hypothetical protein